jgi:hypothetical protein
MASCLPGIATSVSEIASKEICSAVDRFEMTRIDALAHPAKVIEFETDWHCAHKKLVDHQVRLAHRSADANLAVAITKARSPEPASSRVRLELELREQSGRQPSSGEFLQLALPGNPKNSYRP